MLHFLRGRAHLLRGSVKGFETSKFFTRMINNILTKTKLWNFIIIKKKCNLQECSKYCDSEFVISL